MAAAEENKNFNLMELAYPNPNPLLLTLTLESRTLSKSLNNIFFTLFRCQFVYVFV